MKQGFTQQKKFKKGTKSLLPYCTKVKKRVLPEIFNGRKRICGRSSQNTGRKQKLVLESIKIH